MGVAMDAKLTEPEMDCDGVALTEMEGLMPY
jgi:hypothetical protein